MPALKQRTVDHPQSQQLSPRASAFLSSLSLYSHWVTWRGPGNRAGAVVTWTFPRSLSLHGGCLRGCSLNSIPERPPGIRCRLCLTCKMKKPVWIPEGCLWLQEASCWAAIGPATGGHGTATATAGLTFLSTVASSRGGAGACLCSVSLAGSSWMCPLPIPLAGADTHQGSHDMRASMGGTIAADGALGTWPVCPAMTLSDSGWVASHGMLQPTVQAGPPGRAAKTLKRGPACRRERWSDTFPSLVPPVLEASISVGGSGSWGLRICRGWACSLG